MDPWQPFPASNSISEANNSNVVNLALRNEENNLEQVRENISDNSTNSNEDTCKKDLNFGDNFQPFTKLPDSEEYLESLERKLKIIQKGGKKGPNADSILRSLGQTKESCMVKLLSNSVETITVEGEIFEEFKVNPLLKKLAPEKQALSAEELVHLLKADQLEILLGNNNSTGEEGEGSNSEGPGSEQINSAPVTLSSKPDETEKDRDSTENLPSAVDQ